MNDRRRALLSVGSGSILPSEYQQVEYLRSTGTQYINTNVATSTLIGYDIDFLITPDGSTIEQMVIGSSRWGQSRYFLDMNFNNTQTKVQFGVGSYFVIYSSASTNIKYRFLTNVDTNSFGNYELYENGILVASGNETGDISANTNDIYIFCRNNSTQEPTTFACMQLFACKMYDNGIAIRNFIPCYRKSDSVAGLYDIVNNVFYTNAGTGTFIVGNDI